VLRDLMLPLILKATANARSAHEVYQHHIDWDEPADHTQEVTRA
jgi:hypothetical protein